MAFERLREKWRELQQQRTDLVAEYGFIAVGTLFALSIPIYLGFFWLKWKEGGIHQWTDVVTTAGLAWATTRVTLPLRLVGALVLTPFVAKFIRRKKRTDATPPSH